MAKLLEGTPTGSVDMLGTGINIGDKVLLDGETFDVIQNDFNDEIVIDGDTGQESLQKVADMLIVDMGHRYPLMAKEMEIVISSKFKDADDVLRNIWELRNKFATKYGQHVMPNTVYLGENLVTLLNDNHPYTNSVVDVFGMNIVEVLDTDHISLGTTMTKH